MCDGLQAWINTATQTETDNVTPFQLIIDSDPLPAILMPCSATAAESQLCHCHHAGTFPIPAFLCWLLRPVSWHFQFLPWPECVSCHFEQKCMVSYISSTFFLVLFFRTGRKILEKLEQKLPFEVTESTSLHWMKFADHSRSSHVNVYICTMKAQYKTTFNSQKIIKHLIREKKYCIFSKEGKRK